MEIIPETAKLNINAAPPERIFRLLLNLGVEPARAQEIAAAILDWRSRAPGDGASQFDQFYLSRNPSFRPRHASLEETEELLLVKGMTPDIYYGAWQHAAEGGTGGQPRLVRHAGLADCASVFGATDRFDANTAHPALLAAVGVPPDAIAALLARRRELPFQDDGDLSRFFQSEGEAMSRLRVGGNSIFTLRATARLRRPDGAVFGPAPHRRRPGKVHAAGLRFPVPHPALVRQRVGGAMMADYRNLLAFGTGIGIAVLGADLEVAVVRVRPSGAEILGHTPSAASANGRPRSGAPSISLL